MTQVLASDWLRPSGVIASKATNATFGYRDNQIDAMRQQKCFKKKLAGDKVLSQYDSCRAQNGQTHAMHVGRWATPIVRVCVLGAWQEGLVYPTACGCAGRVMSSKRQRSTSHVSADEPVPVRWITLQRRRSLGEKGKKTYVVSLLSTSDVGRRRLPRVPCRFDRFARLLSPVGHGRVRMRRIGRENYPPSKIDLIKWHLRREQRQSLECVDFKIK